MWSAETLSSNIWRSMNRSVLINHFISNFLIRFHIVLKGSWRKPAQSPEPGGVRWGQVMLSELRCRPGTERSGFRWPSLNKPLCVLVECEIWFLVSHVELWLEGVGLYWSGLSWLKLHRRLLAPFCHEYSVSIGVFPSCTGEINTFVRFTPVDEGVQSAGGYIPLVSDDRRRWSSFRKTILLHALAWS